MKRILYILLLCMSASLMQAQIVIGGNVYGGGNKGEVKGSTKVVVRKGDLNKVFGGARMANVGENAYVNIDGENASGYIVINQVYGGNDIAGTIGTDDENVVKELPEELVGNPDDVDNTWDTYVHISTKKTTAGEEHNDAEKIFIGQVFAGGNGNYHYGEPTTADGKTTYKIYQKEEDTNPIATIETNAGEAGITKPDLKKTYLDIQGGTIFYAHGGGNNATVKVRDVIHVDNPSKVVTAIYVDAKGVENKGATEETAESLGVSDILTETRISNLMNVNLSQEHIESPDFQIGRLFGGNNTAAMAIRPLWDLQRGMIRNLYSGGNKGDMTSPEGLLLEIDPKVADNTLSYDAQQAIKQKLKIENVYGGCRMANVQPKDKDGKLLTDFNLSDLDENGQMKYNFPKGLAARVLVRGGNIKNVYGGNDITGKVSGGNAIGVYTSISGDIYGGGNGAYAYTDNFALKDDPFYGDLYYGDRKNAHTYESLESAQALNDYRPHAEQVSIRLKGIENHPTVIGGSVYCGGNCATLKTELEIPRIELKMGSYVVADNVFLGNNGEKMVEQAILQQYAGSVQSGNTSCDFSQMDLKGKTTFATYMEGVTMDKMPSLVFDSKNNGDPDDYIPYSSKIGSFFCGGNVGSMTYPGKNTMVFNAPIIVYNKVVGGCNSADVPESTYNAAYEGGILGSAAEQESYLDNGQIKDRLTLELNKLRIEPRRWVDEQNKVNPDENLVWNTVAKNLDDDNKLIYLNPADGKPINAANGTTAVNIADRRLYGGNIYGGCYNSGHVNGNVVIDINNDLVVCDDVFTIENDEGDYEFANSGVSRTEQGNDVLGAALNVFGAGYGRGTEIWGSTTINLNQGFAFQVFGGGESGYVGKGTGSIGSKTYAHDSKYSTYINLSDKTLNTTITADTPGVAETDYLYGGGFEGVVCGNTYVYLGNGRVYDAIGGACNADILGHTEVYIGKNADGDLGFPYVGHGVYGGNDFGGEIKGTGDHTGVITAERMKMVYDGDNTDELAKTNFRRGLLTSNTYVEYIQGRVDSIYGGNYSYYKYADGHYKKYTVTGTGEPLSGFTKPLITNSFVYFNPAPHPDNDNANVNVNHYVGFVLGGSQGFPNEITNNNSMQERSYVLVDDRSGLDNFATTDVFGGGAYAGLGNKEFMGAGRSAIDLFQGHLHNVYGASNREGLLGYSRINVPSASTIHVNALFGGGKGYEMERILNTGDSEARTSSFCDTYVSCINYQGKNALVDDAIYGGNFNCRITCDTYLNIGVPVKKDNAGNFAKVYGAGYGANTVVGRTNVFLNDGAIVNEVYGGGRNGNTYNYATLTQWLLKQYRLDNQSTAATNLGQYAGILEGFSTYIKGRAADATHTAVDPHPINLPSPLPEYEDNIRTQDMTSYYNTNVHIKEGALVKTNADRDDTGNNGGYAYGGGYGTEATVAGTTCIELLGGTVDKDIYGAGWGGPVYDRYKVGTSIFTAGTNVHIIGGTCRNVYGGGYQGSVGLHTKMVEEEEVNADVNDPYTNDILGETNVIIGRPEEDIRTDSLDFVGNSVTKHGFYYGRPAIQRNAYAGGEGGAVWGTGNITLQNGYIGYVFNAEGTDQGSTTNIDERYEENITDYTWKDEQGNLVPNTNLYDSGCVFGGGYVDNSNVDFTNVYMYGGHVRNSLFGGGEVAAIGRGIILASGEQNSTRELEGIYKAGKTFVDMYGGHVHRNVFGGGRGYNNLGKQGTLHSDGYVFGQTDVHIHGGEIGTYQEMALGNGNVFGGGDIGYVYSAYENEEGKLCVGKKSGVRYDDGDEGYYYKNEGGAYDASGEYTGGDYYRDDGEYVLTEDCKVLIEPHCKVIGNSSVVFTGIFYPKKSRLSSMDIDYLKESDPSLFTGDNKSIDANGIVLAENGITFKRSYKPGDYVPVYALNTLSNKRDDNRWNSIDPTGIIIHNAVFAGGNTSAGSALTYANATSVFGNATASIHDAYHRDLITLGTGHTGGLYGDGNLTFVDGYRGLNITNYGTDYYSIDQTVTIDQYHQLPDREAAYYELKYKCLLPCTDKDDTRYTAGSSDGATKASTITADDMLVLFVEDDGTSVRVDDEGNRVTEGTEGTPVLVKDSEGKWIPNTTKQYWEENGVLPIYAGRLMNSIQRADFCGVFGSRMVLQGARDRVPEEVDLTNYTINRVREVSLNQQWSVIGSDQAVQEFDSDGNYNELYEKTKVHGNYFGIYNIVHYLGALTSDVHFMNESGKDIRRTTNMSNPETYKADINIDNKTYSYRSDGATYYNWKRANIKNSTRNNGSSYNKVALASGVYLELTTEKSTGKEFEQKDWGYITGVIELDLINVQPGIGGGFVYAKNEHRLSTYNPKPHKTLTALNAEAITRKDFDYASPGNEVEWETSGNFVHSTQTIIDDCYNISGKYKGTSAVPAHYWYIKGSIYVYDQYISAYTGTPNAYSEKVEIPLTITAASHGTMKLLDVQPNLYAYYSSPGHPLEDDKKVIINDVTYHKNDPISYWDWFMLSNSEKELFVEKTYVTIADCKIGNKIYPAGTVLLPEDYQALRNSAPTEMIDEESVKAVQAVTRDEYDNLVAVVNDANNMPVYKAFDFVFRESNNLSHNKGYILTYKVNNPTDWNTWYTEYKDASNDADKAREKSQSLTQLADETPKGPNNGPTYRLISSTGGVLGQRNYAVGEMISKEIYDTYKGSGTDAAPEMLSHLSANEQAGQATFVPAYIVTKELSVEETVGEGDDVHQVTHHYNPGAAISQEVSGYTSPAYICTGTIKISEEEYIYLNAQMSQDERDKYIKFVNDEIKKLPGLSGYSYAELNARTKLESFTTTDYTSEQKETLSSLLSLREDINKKVVKAYYCTKEGLYGGDYYAPGTNYRGLEAWSSMSEDDREKFTFNYDAFDLLIDPLFSKDADGKLIYAEGKKYQYDSAEGTLAAAKKNLAVDVNTPAGYSIEAPVDYTATYNGNDNLDLGSKLINVKRDNDEDYNTSTNSVEKDDELSRAVYESLTNEQRNYVPVTMVKVVENENTKYQGYVVSAPFQIGNTPYAVGSVLSAKEYSGLSDYGKSCVTQLEYIPTTSESNSPQYLKYYYCRESYQVGKNGNGVEVSNAANVTAKTVDGENVTKVGTYNSRSSDMVPVGLVIPESKYEDLITNNQQKDFVIHGIAPTETSTLYVSRNSDIFDLSKEKIITVVYQYDYEEVDDKGGVTPISERHVLNIHINFESGVPTVEDITPPKKVIPGDKITIPTPGVTPGAYEVLGGGWTLFETKDDAESHINGIDFVQNSDPLYWYQDGYYVAYYAKTYLGKTYSNAVPVGVANYHDLKKVMDDKVHHYYVDRPDVQRDSKIYIDNYTTDNPATSQNGLDLLKNFFDLSLLIPTPAELDANGLIKSGTFSGHAPLNKHVHSARNLEFFLSTDIEREKETVDNPYYDEDDPQSPATITRYKSWTPIGTNNIIDNPATPNVDEAITQNGACFEGTFHGEGHTISGLTSSLFNHLCGDVYNLGVTGSFTGGGIAEEGSGYVENCWISTTAATKSDQPVFASPNRTGEGLLQIVNSYYLEDDADAYTTVDGVITTTPKSGSYTQQIVTNNLIEHGTPTRKPAQAFYNGEVAYDLNGFYLYKRYSDQEVTSGTAYKYYTINSDNTLSTPQTKFYGTGDASLCSSGSNGNKYVEERYADGDYRYAGGFVPDEADERLYIDEADEGKLKFYPIWPDDYLFFGQVLNYGYGTELDHQHDEHPTYVLKKDGRVVDTREGNRVYRAPAYFRSMEMGVAHYNAWANMAAKSKDGTKDVYPGMTAIDFTGYNDANKTYEKGWSQWSKTSQSVDGSSSDAYAFYPPLLDNDGLVDFENHDETKNLLVYIPEDTDEGNTSASMTRKAVKARATDPNFGLYYMQYDADPDRKYKTVATNTTSVSYHVVEKNGNKYQSTYDHFLVDKEEFNSPIEYDFTNNKRMWYQRLPEKYVNIEWNGLTPTRTTKGWEDVSLPFTAELVTTNEKGEITHFYGDSKTGHEYWLREYNGGSQTSGSVFTAILNYPDPSNNTSEMMDKVVTNTYLWDYFYKYENRHNHLDANADTYQTYYEKSRPYADYLMLTRGTPYIIGFPSKRYYEFDLSGEWVAENTAKVQPQLKTQTRQIITFASAENAPIGVSDKEMDGVEANGFVFKPNYLKETLISVAEGEEQDKPRSYYLNATGDAYVDEGEGEITVVPFRPYFETANQGNARSLYSVRQIVFDREENTSFFEDRDPSENDADGALTFYVRGVVIGVQSTLSTDVPVQIVSTSGLTLATFTIHSGETIETPVPTTGVYIIRANGGKFNRKVTVK